MSIKFNSMYNRMLPLTASGRFDYSQPILTRSGYDMRTPLHKNEVYVQPAVQLKPLDINPIKIEPLAIKPIATDLTSPFLRKKCMCLIGYCTC